MLGRVTYRGSFKRRSAVTTAGNKTARVCNPPSTSRVTWASRCPSSPDTTSLDAKVACGKPHRAASIWPVWLASSSMACLPITTRSGLSRATTAANSLATASGSKPAAWASSSTTSTARSAPMAMAVRSTSWLTVVPQLTATTSVATPDSLSRTASSTAISSKGFMLIFTLAMSTSEPSGLTRTFTL